MKCRTLETYLATTAIIIAACTAFSCKNPELPEIQPPPPPEPPYAWRTSTPGAQGLSSDSLALALQEFQAQQYVESFVLVRNGWLVKESYYTLAGKYTNASIASMTKSVGSALVGIALREHSLDSLGQKLMSFFPEFNTPTMDPRKRNITIEHLLTMRAGFDYNEGDDHSNLFNSNTNWMREAINIPLRTNPGEVFNYASVNAHLVSGILTKATHVTAESLGRRYLLHPLGINVISWPRDPQNYSFLGSGLVMYPRDLARLGYVYVNGGAVDGQSIIPVEWVHLSTQPHDDQSRTWGAFANVRYGYLWWTAQWNTDSVFLAVGFGGQFIVGVPRHNMVIVVTSNLNCTQAEADQRHLAILDIVARHVLTAVEN